jgi:hypothetical protein
MNSLAGLDGLHARGYTIDRTLNIGYFPEETV